MARKLCDQTVSAVAHFQIERGRHIACRRGCSACCRYLVPVNEVEALDLMAHVESLPAPRRLLLLEAFDTAAATMLRAGPPPVDPDPQALSAWYLGLGLPCPMLADGECVLYDRRPLACREHMVTTPASACRGARPAGEPIQMPVSVAQAVADLTAELTGKPAQTAFLPLALHWAKTRTDLARAVWPAQRVFGTLARILRNLAKPAMAPECR